MTDFKVGDRVRVYGHKALDWETTDARVIERGVDELIHAEFIMVLANNGLRVLVHPKQCRRLVKTCGGDTRKIVNGGPVGTCV